MSIDARLSRTPPGRHTLKLLLIPVIGMVIANNVANALWASLHEDHPLLLIALSSINRYLILVSDQLDALSYYGVGTARLLASDPMFFLLGYWYGDRALEWLDQRSPTYGPLLRKAQRLFGRAAWALVLIAPNNYICMLAGAAGMRVSWFFALNLTGTVARLYAIRVLGATFSSPIDSFRGFVADYQIWILAASIGLVAFSVWRESRGGGDLADLRSVEHDLLDADPDETVTDETGPDDPVPSGG